MFNLVLFYELAVSMLRFDSYGMGYVAFLCPVSLVCFHRKPRGPRYRPRQLQSTYGSTRRISGVEPSGAK